MVAVEGSLDQVALAIGSGPGLGSLAHSLRGLGLQEQIRFH